MYREDDAVAQQRLRLSALLGRISIAMVVLTLTSCCTMGGWSKVEQLKTSLRCGMTHEEVFSLAVTNGARFDCGLSTDLTTCSIGHCYRFVRCNFDPRKGLSSYKDLEFRPLTIVKEIEHKDLCKAAASSIAKKQEAATDDFTRQPAKLPVNEERERHPTSRERRFERRLVCGASPTDIRFAAFELDSRSFLCEMTPSLTCSIVFETRAYRTTFQNDRLSAIAIGAAIGMRGRNFGAEGSPCEP